MGRARQRNFGCRVVECAIEGVGAIILENRTLRVGVLVEKGADIYEFLYKPRDVDPLWRSPLGIVAPGHGLAGIASHEGTFMDVYEGGWQELFPSLGPPSLLRGAELGTHGEVALLPWDYQITRDSPDEVQVVLRVRTRRMPFVLQRTLTLRGEEPVLYIEEEATNEAAETVPFMWGHHPVLGAPFLQPGCLLSVPGGRVNPSVLDEQGHFQPTGISLPWPSYRSPGSEELQDLRQLPAPNEKYIDEFYLSDLPAGWYAVTNPALRVGFALRWQKEVFPYLWLWRTLGPASGYPWYGNSYMLGLEPFSSVPPHAQDAERAGTLLTLGPGETLHTSLLATAFEGATAVTEVDARGMVRCEERL